MKKLIIGLLAGGALALGCTTAPDDKGPDPIPLDTRNNPPGASPSVPKEQRCFDDDLAAVRKMAKDGSEWVRPDSCHLIHDDRFWEIHRLVLLKFEANG